MEDPNSRYDMDWSQHSRYPPRPDYLSSSRKRLVPQLLYKGSILKEWGKKQAVAIHKNFYRTLPDLPLVSAQEADMAWLIYDLVLDHTTERFQLVLDDTIYTSFRPTLTQITTPDPGPIADFMDDLQERLDTVLIDDEHNAPDAPPLDDIL